MQTPVMRAMKDGKLARIEELTRVGSDVQDTLITILSEKTLLFPSWIVKYRLSGALT